MMIDRTIKEVFKDYRGLTQLDNTSHLFGADDGELIYVDLVLDDFTIDTLLEYVSKAEELYDEYETKVTIYLLCCEDSQIQVKEFPVMSKADFDIKMAKTDLNPVNVTFEVIYKKLDEGLELTDTDKVCYNSCH